MIQDKRPSRSAIVCPPDNDKRLRITLILIDSDLPGKTRGPPGAGVRPFRPL
jgi:hypothetical protein